MGRSPKSADAVTCVEVLERGAAGPADNWIGCSIDGNIRFSTRRLQEYCFVPWQPIIYDTLLVAAAVEFCDKLVRRPGLRWQRSFLIRVPVHEPERWSATTVYSSLIDALQFLTGDQWRIEFRSRAHPEAPPPERLFDFAAAQRKVIPFSEGLDSLTVGALVGAEEGDDLIRIRVGKKVNDRPSAKRKGSLFTSVPYQVRSTSRRFQEGSGRSRGFKFAIVSALTAYLLKAQEIVLPESGQGAIGPVLLPVGQGYEDYRNHPLFTDRMERLVAALFGHTVRFDFPRLWYTKGETVRDYVAVANGSAEWARTRSCWQQNRQVSVSGKQRQCGICAACMLRRLSIHTAGLVEANDVYVWERLDASTFEAGAAPAFDMHTKALHEYAIAGVLHMDHMADLATSTLHTGIIARHAAELARSRKLTAAEAEARLRRMLTAHANEWKAFMESLGDKSFVRRWAAL